MVPNNQGPYKLPTFRPEMIAEIQANLGVKVWDHYRVAYTAAMIEFANADAHYSRPKEYWTCCKDKLEAEILRHEAWEKVLHIEFDCADGLLFAFRMAKKHRPSELKAAIFGDENSLTAKRLDELEREVSRHSEVLAGMRGGAC